MRQALTQPRITWQRVSNSPSTETSQKTNTLGSQQQRGLRLYLMFRLSCNRFVATQCKRSLISPRRSKLSTPSSKQANSPRLPPAFPDRRHPPLFRSLVKYPVLPRPSPLQIRWTCRPTAHKQWGTQTARTTASKHVRKKLIDQETPRYQI